MPDKRTSPSRQRLNDNSSSSSSSRTASPATRSTTRFPPPTPQSQRWSRSSRDSNRRLSGGISRSALSSPRTPPSSRQGFLRRNWDAWVRWARGVLAAFWKLSPMQRVVTLLVMLLGGTFVIITLIYTERFFAWLATVSKSWREMPGGWIIAFLLVFVTSFPPVVGYSTANTVAGFVFGFPMGWPIAASGCILGSLAAFIACRTVLSKHVHMLIGNDHRFVALGQVLRRDGLLYLTGIRFCPLPFSLSNGFLATIPSISPASFALSTALASPKLLIHIFIGSRLAIIAEEGDDMPVRDKVVNYIGMLATGLVGAAAGIIVYRRTMAHAAELAREETLHAAEEGEGGYEDTDDTLMDPEDAANVMGDDDVSLWETQVNDDWDDGDDQRNDGDDGARNVPNNKFRND